MWELQGERLIGAAGCVASAQRCFDRTMQYAKEREAFGRSIGHFQVIRHKFAEMATKIEAARQLVYMTAWRHENGEYPVREISMAKLYASRIAVEVADECIQIHGGAGYMKEYGIERAWRDLRLNRIGAGTDEIMLDVIGRSLRALAGVRRWARCSTTSAPTTRRSTPATPTGSPSTSPTTRFTTTRGLAPTEGGRAIAEYAAMGVEHIEGRWFLEDAIEDDERVVIEWTMTWRDPESGERRLDRGTEWFEFRDGKICEVRAYHHGNKKNPQGDLLGFDHAGRGYTML